MIPSFFVAMDTILPTDSLRSVEPMRGFELTPIEDFLSRGLYAGGVDPFSVHRANDYMILYIDKGAGKHTIDLKSYPVHPGAFLFVGPRQIMQFDRSKSFGGFLIRFNSGFLHPFGQNEEIRALTRLYDNTSETPIIDARRHREIITFFELVHKEYRHSEDGVRGDILRSSLELLLLHAGRLVSGSRKNANASVSGFAHFSKFKTMLANRVDTSRNALDYAQEIGISYKYLNDLCKQHSGMTAKDLIDGERIAEAQRMLIRDQFSVRETASQLGFNDVSNFRKYFRKFTGMAPADFRERHHTS